MIEFLAHLFILFLIIAFSLVAIAGNVLRHATRSSAERQSRPDAKAREYAAPRAYVLHPTGPQDQPRAA